MTVSAPAALRRPRRRRRLGAVSDDLQWGSDGLCQLAARLHPAQISSAKMMKKVVACILLVAMALGSAECAQPMCYTPEV
jgi:hypothetical protein